MRSRAAAVVASIFLTLVVVSCGRASGSGARPPTTNQTAVTPVPASGLGIAVLSTVGPANPYQTHAYFVGTSLAKIRGSVIPGHYSPGCNPSVCYDSNPGCEPSVCWPGITDDGSHLYVEAMLTFKCSHLAAVSAELVGGVGLDITVSTKGVCPPGGASAPTPPMTLMGLPLRLLPHGVTIQVNLIDATWGPPRSAPVQLP